MPEPLARLVTDTITRSAAASAVGWVFTHAGQWGVFLPERSDDPAWPPGTTYLKAGTHVTLPPFTWGFAECDGTSGWVSQDGGPLSRPLLLHPIVSLLATDVTCSASPEPEGLTMPTACLTPAPAHAAAPAPAYPRSRGDRGERGHEGPTLAEVLDLQEAEVPHTADALDHFFGDV
ncbi:hypothetical protein [Streptomyces sp. NRRL WC-3626]|nr:hypothetical protein [Streptomyces sp. NRRL WC-3626]